MAKLQLEALKKHIASLFEKSQDQETIKQYAIVENEFNKVQEAWDKQEEKELSLLKDLKEAYLHTAVTSNNNDGTDVGGTFDADSLIQNFVQTHNADGSEKK